jgi:tetratricopeptide (TPR) repeat protein
MLLGQLFVGRPVSFRHILAAIGLPLALLLAGCSSSHAEAQEQAQLAEQLMAQGDPRGANQAIDKAIRLRGDDPNLYLMSAKIKTALRDYAQAFEAYRTILALDPNHFEALVAVAVLGGSMGDPVRARDAADRALAIDPNQLDVLMTLGMLELEDKRYDAAEAVAERIIAAHPDNPSGYVLKARAFALRGRNAEGLALLRQTAERLGNSVMISSAMLEAARAQGDVATMREQYALIASERPESASLALDEVNLLYKTGDTEAARRVGADMLNRLGNNAEAMRRLHALWTEYDRDPLGPGDLAALREGGIEARLMVARFLLDQNRLEEAGALVEGAGGGGRAVDPRLAGLGTRIAIRQGNAGAARGARAILEDDKTNCEALSAIAEWELSQRRLQESVRAAQVLATQCLDRIDGYLLLARAYQAANRPAAIERVFRDGIEAHPDSPVLARRFSDWLLSQERGEAAVAIANKLTKIAPNRNSSWRLLGDVCRRAARPSCAARAAQGLAAARKDYRLETLAEASDKSLLLGRQWD